MFKNLIAIVFVLTFLLSACSSKQVPTESVDIPPIYTSAANTAIAEARFAPPTVTPIQEITVTSIQTFPAVSTPTPFMTLLPVPRVAAKGVPIHSLSNDCHNAAFISDLTFPDGAELAPGESFLKSWKFENTGNCPWRNKFSIIFRRGDDMGGTDTDIDKIVTPGRMVKISVSLTAPGKEGTYTGFWMLADADGNAFGNEVSVRIVVSKAAATPAP